VKRRVRVRRLHDAAREAGATFVSLRNTGGHEVFELCGYRTAVPNHREIAEGTAASILRQAATALAGER
jgi:predicted RNA binding protein YcfA (HicA-like mRNA interferase family)